ncbi:MAG: ABC transporter permease, partial [Gammaproteobacteria bacterium]
PAILLAFIFVPVLIQQFQTAHDYAVVDQSGWLLKAVDQHIAADDYARLLTLAAHPPAGNADALPALLVRLAPAAAQLDDPGRKALAQALATGGPAPTTSPALVIWNQREAFTHWYQGLSAEQAGKLDRSLAIACYHQVNMPSDALRNAVTQGTLFGYFVLPADPLASDARITYASRNLTDTELRDWYGEQISAVVRTRKAAQVGLSDDKTQWLEQPLGFHNQLVTKAGAKTATAAEKAAQWVPVGYVYLLFFSIMSIVQLLMMMLIEEKSNRIAESLLASVDATDIMAGKTLGVAAVGVTMICSWLAIILGLLAAFGSEFQMGGFASAVLAGISAWNIVWFIVYFVLGFLLYAAVLGAVGSAINNIREAQPYMMPVML